MAEKEKIYSIKIDSPQTNLQNLKDLQAAINQLAAEKSEYTKQIKANQKEIATLEQKQNALLQSSKNIAEQVEKGNLTAAEGARQERELVNARSANIAVINSLGLANTDLAEKQVEINLELKHTTASYRENEKAVIDNKNSTAAAEGSIEEMRISLRQAQQEYIKLSAAERENAEIGGVLQASIAEQDAALKALESSIGINQRSVGDYGKAVSDVTPLLGSFGQQINSVMGTLDQIKTAISSLGQVTGNVGRTVVGGFGAAQKSAKDMGDGMKASFGNATASTQQFAAAQNISNSTTNEGRNVVKGFGAAQASTTATTQTATTATKAQTVATKAMTASTSLASKGFKILKIALMSTGIGAIVVALGSLIAAFATTQRGADAIAAALAPVKEAFATFLGFLQNTGFKVFDRLKAAINNPRQALADFANFLKDQVVNRVKGAFNLILETGKWFSAGFRVIGLNFKKALDGIPILGGGIDTEQLKKDLKEAEQDVKNAAKNMANATLQVATGVEDVIGKVGNAATKAGAALDASNKRAAEMERLRRAIERREVTINKELAAGNRLFEEQKKIAEDETATQAVRLAATQKAQEALKANVQLEDSLLQMKIKRAKLATEANDTDLEALKEISDLEAERDQKAADATGKSIELRNKENSIRKKAADDAQKAIDAEKKKQEEAEKEKTRTAKEQALKQVDDKAKMLELENQLTLATTETTDEERYQMEVDLQNRLFELKKEKAILQGEELLFIEKEQQVKLAELKKEEDARIAEMEAEKKEKEKEEKEAQEAADLEARKQWIDAGFEAAETVSNSIFENQNRRREQDVKREVEALQLKKQAGVISQEEFEKARLEIDRKAFERQKRTNISQAIANAALAGTKTLANLGLPAAIPALAVLGIKTAAEIASIGAQQFAEGGFTGQGLGFADSTGHKVAGVVHANEYVTPEKVLKNPLAAPHIAALERMRNSQPNPSALRGFANGGFTSPNKMAMGMDMVAFKDAIVESINTIKVQNVATETSQIANRVEQIQNSATF